jgi:hypothetical protein
MSARGSLGAVPAHLWLVRRGYKRCWMYVTLGACLGIATLSIFAFPQFFGNNDRTLVSDRPGYVGTRHASKNERGSISPTVSFPQFLLCNSVS